MVVIAENISQLSGVASGLRLLTKETRTVKNFLFVFRIPGAHRFFH